MDSWIFCWWHEDTTAWQSQCVIEKFLLVQICVQLPVENVRGNRMIGSIIEWEMACELGSVV